MACSIRQFQFFAAVAQVTGGSLGVFRAIFKYLLIYQFFDHAHDDFYAEQ